MAKKKENELTYLQYPLPQGGRAGKMTKLDWSGLNYRNTKDTGEISKELNISTHFAPFLTPSEVKKEIKTEVFKTYFRNATGDDGAVEWEEENKPEIFPADIKYLEGYYFIQGYYGESQTSDGTSEQVQKCIYQVYDKEFKLMQSIM
ncbi:MAG: hypothetical protein U0L72_10730, partial [Acutalibacteraceae bacterium]|nr:hypothetical protein [Acutalibacteraceae bacterium]